MKLILSVYLFVSQVSTDLNIVDFDLPFSITLSVGATSNTYANLVVLAVVTWQVLFVSVPMVYLAIRLQVTILNELSKKGTKYFCCICIYNKIFLLYSAASSVHLIILP